MTPRPDRPLQVLADLLGVTDFGTDDHRRRLRAAVAPCLAAAAAASEADPRNPLPALAENVATATARYVDACASLMSAVNAFYLASVKP